MTAPSLRETILSEALEWIATPYHHQQAVKGVGCDCLGFVRGVWRAVYGVEPETPPNYSPDWGDFGQREILHDAALRHMEPIAVEAAAPGDLILFRMRDNGPSKHLAILAKDGDMIHARAQYCVVREPYSFAWRRRAVAAFVFPERS